MTLYRRSLEDFEADMRERRKHGERPMSEVNTSKSNGKKASAPPKAPKVAKEPKAKREPKVRTHGGFRPDAKITLLMDKEGKNYGPDHNPKRKGSRAAKLFSIYQNGMTVDEFIQNGGTGSALRYDNGHNFIKVT